MYPDEFSDKESDPEVLQAPPTIVRKSLADVRRSPVAAVTTDHVSEQDMQSLTLDDRNEAKCPCGCYHSAPTAGPFRTRDKNTLALFIVWPCVLHYHGTLHDPSQIATFWKKDCRKFLWKGKSKDGADAMKFHKMASNKVNT